MLSSEKSFDVIVIGLGGVGSATVAHLAANGYRVLGIDQFSPPHNLGSSHGQTRVIRKAYFEHPDYVPMLLRSYELWKELESTVGQQLYFPVGLLQVGPIEGEVLSGVRRSATEHHLDVDQITFSEAQQRYPGIEGDQSWTAIIEHDAGYLLVERCVEAHLSWAERSGATLLREQPVLRWQSDGSGVSVTTDQTTFRASSLVIAAGPWADRTVQQYRLPLRVIRKHVYWFKTESGFYQSEQFPCFFFDTADGFFYGIPQFKVGDSQWSGLKVGRHTGGQPAHPADSPTHASDDQDRIAVEGFLRSCLPQVTFPMIQWQGCYYTMTPDQHFIVDRLPDAPQVTVIAGLSGHGFKFTSVLGEIAGRLSTGRSSSVEIGFLGLNRFN